MYLCGRVCEDGGSCSLCIGTENTSTDRETGEATGSRKQLGLEKMKVK